MANIVDRLLIKTAPAFDSKIAIDQNMATLLSEIDNKKSFRQIATKTALSSAAFKESLKKLVSLKLVKMENTAQESYITENFLIYTRNILIQVAGPLGEILLLETAEQMALDMAKIPTNIVEEFISNIASQVPGQKQRTEFKSIMLEKIKLLRGYGDLKTRHKIGDLN